MKKLTPIVALLSLGTVPALTYGAETENPSGPYVGVGWGQFNLNVDKLDDVDDAISDVFDSDDNAWKAFAGWRFNPYIALEAAYIDFGRPNDKISTGGSSGDYRVDLSGFAPYVIGTLPLGPVELFGKAGYYFYDVKVRVDLDANERDLDTSSSEQDFLYGVGIGTTIANRVHLRAEYEKVDADFADDADAFWLSAAFRF